MAPAKKRSAPWDKKAAWSRVDVGDDFMLGSTEGGFMGLEVLGPEETKFFGHHDVRHHSEAQDTADDNVDEVLDATMVPKQNKGLKRQRAEETNPKKRPRVSAEAATGVSKTTPEPSTLAALTAKIAALEAENSALKGQGGSIADQPGQQNKAKKKKKGKKQAKASEDKSNTAALPVVASSSAEEDTQIDTNSTDMSAWMPFDLHPKVAEAVAQMGFGQPTPIQQECLLPAIRDRRDVIGAAQTVGLLSQPAPATHHAHLHKGIAAQSH